MWFLLCAPELVDLLARVLSPRKSFVPYKLLLLAMNFYPQWLRAVSLPNKIGRASCRVRVLREVFVISLKFVIIEEKANPVIDYSEYFNIWTAITFSIDHS